MATKWNKQMENDIYDVQADWESTYFKCVMKDGTSHLFVAFLDENAMGEVSMHVECVDDDNYCTDDINYWTEVS